MALHSDGLPFQMCIFFTLNPGAALFTGEISKKWGVQRHLISDRLDAARKNGLLSINKVHGEIEQFYSAGPKLNEYIKEMG